MLEMYIVTKGESVEDAIDNHDKPYKYEYEAVEDMKDLDLPDPQDGIIAKLVWVEPGSKTPIRTDLYWVHVDEDGAIKADLTTKTMTVGEMEEKALHLITTIFRNSKKNLPYTEDYKELKMLLHSTPKLRAMLLHMAQLF